MSGITRAIAWRNADKTIQHVGWMACRLDDKGRWDPAYYSAMGDTPEDCAAHPEFKMWMDLNPKEFTAKGIWVYSTRKIDRSGNMTENWEFIPDLNPSMFEGRSLILDLHNACKKAIATCGYVGDYFSTNPAISNSLAFQITAKSGFYKGETYAILQDHAGGTTLLRFDDEPVNTRKVGYGHPITTYSVNLFWDEPIVVDRYVDPLSAMAGFVDERGNNEQT